MIGHVILLTATGWIKEADMKKRLFILIALLLIPCFAWAGLGGELVTNGTFDAEAPWEIGSDWTVAGGIATCAEVAGVNNQIYQSITYTVNQPYRLTFDLVVTSGTLYVYKQSGAQIEYTTSGAKVYEWTDVATTYPYIAFRGLTGFAGTVDNVSIKPVLGGGKWW